MNSTNCTHTNNLRAFQNSLPGKLLFNRVLLPYVEWKRTQMPASVLLSAFKKMCKLQLLLGKQLEQLVYPVQGKTHLSFSPAVKTVTSPLCSCIPKNLCSCWSAIPSQHNSRPHKTIQFQTNTHFFLLMVSLHGQSTVANEEKLVYYIKMVFTSLGFLNFPFKHC